MTLIEWTNVTDNIIVVEGGGWWCCKISPACFNCYAERLNQNTFFGGNKLPYTGQAPKLVLRREILKSWRSQRKPKKHFVCSMTDLFGGWVPQDWQFDALDAMAAAPLQTFQLLTKRADVMTSCVLAWLRARGRPRVPGNIWLGFSAENQYWFDQRWAAVQPLLPVKSVLWISAEPLIGQLNIMAAMRLDWVVTGGETGPQSKPCRREDFRNLRDQCQRAGKAFFFKQWGDYAHVIHKGTDLGMFRMGKKKAGRVLDEREWSEFPESGR